MFQQNCFHHYFCPWVHFSTKTVFKVILVYFQESRKVGIRKVGTHFKSSIVDLHPCTSIISQNQINQRNFLATDRLHTTTQHPQLNANMTLYIQINLKYQGINSVFISGNKFIGTHFETNSVESCIPQ